MNAGLPDSKLLFDGSLIYVSPVGPSGDLRSQGRDASDEAIVQALTGQGTQFPLAHVELATVFGRIDEIDLSHTLTRLFGRERFIDRPLRMYVEFVANRVLCRVSAYRLSGKWASSYAHSILVRCGRVVTARKPDIVRANMKILVVPLRSYS